MTHSLRAAQHFSGFPLYWDGMRLGDLPLTGVTSAPDHNGIGYTFIYGTFVNGNEGCCPPPLEVQITALCNRLPRQLGVHLARLVIRGAPTSAAEGGDNGGDFSIYTKGATITFFGARKLDLQAAAALRGANQLAHTVGPTDPLPPPPKQAFIHGC